jgi:hypothetical protein
MCISGPPSPSHFRSCRRRRRRMMGQWRRRKRRRKRKKRRMKTIFRPRWRKRRSPPSPMTRNSSPSSPLRYYYRQSSSYRRRDDDDDDDYYYYDDCDPPQRYVQSFDDGDRWMWMTTMTSWTWDETCGRRATRNIRRVRVRCRVRDLVRRSRRRCPSPVFIVRMTTRTSSWTSTSPHGSFRTTSPTPFFSSFRWTAAA